MGRVLDLDQLLARYRALVRVYWRDFENAFLQHQSGLLSDEGWEVYIDLICDNRQRFASTWYLHEPISDFDLPEILSKPAECLA